MKKVHTLSVNQTVQLDDMTITYSIVCLCISMGMFVYFITFEIPRLDEHLGKKYGNEFAEYSQVTKRFVPFVY